MAAQVVGFAFFAARIVAVSSVLVMAGMFWRNLGASGFAQQFLQPAEVMAGRKREERFARLAVAEEVL